MPGGLGLTTDVSRVAGRGSKQAPPVRVFFARLWPPSPFAPTLVDTFVLGCVLEGRVAENLWQMWWRKQKEQMTHGREKRHLLA